MPRFVALSKDRVAELTTRRGPSQVDLTEHKKWLDESLASSNGWGEILLDPGDNIRALKRRTTIAAKEMGKIVKWNRKSTDSSLIFQAVDPNAVQRRTRRVKQA